MRRLIQSIIRLITDIFNWGLDLIFPVFCFNCGLEGSYLCSSCLNEITCTPEPQICLACAKPSQNFSTHKTCLHNCPLDGFIHAVSYKQTLIHKIVHNLKYNGVQQLANTTASIIVNKLAQLNQQEHFQNFLVIPIPSHNKRRRIRGYNQTELIAQQICRQINLNYQPQMLTKIKHSKAQATLNKSQRQQNLQNAFTANPNVANQKILLIDDVATTGATLFSAATALKTAQAESVWAVTLAYEA